MNMAITATLVKELRDQTGAGMMDCKKALTETDGDLEKASEFLRENGLAQAAKKAGRIAAEGLTSFEISGNTAMILEVNCETDFVAKNDDFKQFIADVSQHILTQHPSSVEKLLSQKLN